MIRLVGFELEKIWKKRSFLLSLCALLIVNFFLLWYTSLPDGTTPPLSAYGKVQEDLTSLSEREKFVFLSNLKEDIDGICFVRDIQNMQNLSGEMGQTLAEQEIAKRPGIFEKYQKDYLNVDYLRYTSSLEEEEALIREIYDEMEKVSSYGEYLSGVQNQRSTLSGISIFAKDQTASFANRNIEKSASDYADLDTKGIRFSPSKGIFSAMENIWTDFLILLSVFFFVGTLIMEEKQRGLFLITRPTKYGIIHSTAAKLAALLVHSMAIGFLFYGCNLLYFEMACGLGDLTARLQSLAPYRESALNVSVLVYLFLSIGTKALVAFAVGALLSALAIRSNKIFASYLWGTVILAIGWLLYQFVSATSNWNLLKYLNPYALLQTKNIYGSYLNLNILGYPISLWILSWIVLLGLMVFGIGLSIFFYMGKSSQSTIRPSKTGQLKTLSPGKAKKFSIPTYLSFRPHDSLFRHEAYKLLIAKRALLVLLLCIVLIGGNALSKAYHPSITEQYYQTLMLELEGELTREKENLITAEQQRFDEAFAQIEHIDEMIASDKISENTGESMKQKYYSVTAFYPAFEKVYIQYDRITETGGVFLYDTGWLYLFGILDDSLPIYLLLLSLGISLGFANTFSMEEEKNAWNLIGATKQGRKQIIRQKIRITILCSALLSLTPWIFRFFSIEKVFPMHQITAQLQSIPQFADFPLTISVWGFFLIAVISQILTVMVIAAAILSISHWRKNHLQALFFAFLLLVVPLILSILGLDFARWFSVYPIYGLTWICQGL